MSRKAKEILDKTGRKIEELRRWNKVSKAALYAVMVPEDKRAASSDNAKIAAVNYKLEHASEMLTSETLFRLADFFGVDVDYLLCRMETRTHDLEFLKIETGLDEKALAFLKSRNFGAFSKYRPLREDGTFENVVRGLPGLAGVNATFGDETKAAAVFDGINDYFAALLALQETKANKEKPAAAAPAVADQLIDDETGAAAAVAAAEVKAVKAFRAMLEGMKKDLPAS